MRVLLWIKFRVVFTCWGMICQSVGHTTEHTDVVSGDIEEEVGDHFISDGWLKDLLLVADREPLVSLKALRHEKGAPMKHHPFHMVIDKI